MTINCKGQLIDLNTPRVMGILNLTPDSFYDGGKLKSDSDMLRRVETMLQEGATFIDIGGYSSRPNAPEVSLSEELNRTITPIALLTREFPEILISIDTFRAAVAREAISAGACMINDISAGHLDQDMMPLAAALQVPYIMMHMRGTPQTMGTMTAYTDLVSELIWYFSERIQQAKALHLHDLIIDPGFGFAKTREDNFRLLDQLEYLSILDFPLLAGISRKSMIYKTLDTLPENALNGTTALNMIALSKGAKILRVHDTREAMECIILHQQLAAGRSDSQS